MGFGALAAVLKRDGHEIVVWSQDMHHWPDDHLRTYLDENKFDVVVLSIIAGYYQYQKVKVYPKRLMLQNKDHFLLWEDMAHHQNLNFSLKKSGADVVSMGEGEISVCKLMEELAKQKEKQAATHRVNGYKKFQV